MKNVHFLVVAVAAFSPPLIVYASGMTFAQRCERYLPIGSEIERAICVEYLVEGGSVAGLHDAIREVEQ